MNKVVEELGKIGIVPVIALDDAKDAEPLAKALIDGGLPCAEVTFRTAAAQESIKIMADKFPELIVGAGTVLTPEQADKAMEAGAKFIVSPGLNPKVVKHCMDKGYPIVPGTSNPSDVEVAIELGLDVVKFFPAEAAGGLNMIKSMAAPYTSMKFMPTGGINANNLKSYLDFGKIVCCGGSWMVKKDMVAAGDFAGIEKLTREAVDTMLGFEVRHVGVNMESGEAAEELADTLQKMFSFEKKVGNSSVFAGTGFELMKKPGRGANGHIAIATNYIDRAVYHLEKRGFEFEQESAVIKEGKLKKEKPLSPITADDIPFEVPDGWEWVRLQDAATAIVDCPHSTPKYLDNETGFYAIGTKGMNGDGEITRLFNVDESTYLRRTERIVPHAGDIVYSREGSIICRAVILPEEKQICLGQRVMLIRCNMGFVLKFLQTYLMSDLAISYLTQNYKGTGVRHINVADVCSLPIPIPPLAEQQRIAERVEELLAVCRQLSC